MKAYKIVKRPLNTAERTELILNKMNDFYRTFNCGDLLCNDCKLQCIPNEKGEMGCIFQYISPDRSFLDRYNEKDDCFEERIALEGRELQVAILAKSLSDLINCCKDYPACNDCPLYTSDEHRFCPPDNPSVKVWVDETLDGVVFEE